MKGAPTHEEMERMKAEVGLPPEAKIVEACFDPRALIEKYPRITQGPREVLEAFQEEFRVEREVAAILALQFVELCSAPIPGHEQEFYASLDWLREQAGTYKMKDATGGELQAAKAENQKDWRRT